MEQGFPSDLFLAKDTVVERRTGKVVANVKGTRPTVGTDVDSDAQQTGTRERETQHADSVRRERTASRRTTGITCKRDIEHIGPQRNR